MNKMLKATSMTLCLGLASLTFSQNVNAGLISSDVIFGSGNANGGFTTSQIGSLELGLRAKLRYNLNGDPENTFPWDGNNTYTFNDTDGVAPANRAIWNFEWSINTNWDDNGSSILDSGLFFALEIIGDNGFDAAYDPLSFDAWLGFNNTANGSGTYTTDASNSGSYNVAQNSVNIGFANNLGNPGFDPQSLGEYSITLSAFANEQAIGRNTIFINMQSETSVVSAPATLAIFSLGLGLIGIRRMRRHCTK